FVALAIDVGMVLVARTQVQNAADAAAMAGARTIDGSASSNLTQATANAKAAGALNQVLSNPIKQSEVTVQHGTYHYDVTGQTFAPNLTTPLPSGDNYNLTQV